MSRPALIVLLALAAFVVAMVAVQFKPAPIEEPTPDAVRPPWVPEVKPEPPKNPGWGEFNAWFSEHVKTCEHCAKMEGDPNVGFCLDAFKALQGFLGKHRFDPEKNQWEMIQVEPVPAVEPGVEPEANPLPAPAPKYYVPQQRRRWRLFNRR